MLSYAGMPFPNEPHQRRVEKPWGHEIIWTPADLGRTGKIIAIHAGRRLSLQYHDDKEETLCLLRGRAILWISGPVSDELERIEMLPEQGYTVRPFQRHRLEAIEDALVLEVSSPERGNTVRVEDDYARTTETESDRAARDAALTA